MFGKLIFGVAFCTAVTAPLIAAQSTQGILGLVQRRLPNHAADFSFSLNNSVTSSSNSSTPPNDHYTISTTANGTILVEGNSPIALASGLHRYLTDVAHVDIYWYVGSRLHLAPSILPRPAVPVTGSSIVPWRYHFNTVTFSYTSAFWSWDDWELELDWLALRGVNLPLAWVGQEKIVVEVFKELGMTDAEISSFLSGPAFQAWNRFGNIQGSWDGDLPTSWIDGQFELQLQIVQRMVELGMTPVLPSFTGFVPRAISRVRPNAAVVNGSQWSRFPSNYTNVTFLEPFDNTFAEIQQSFITKQAAAYGNASHIYTLDQYNENDPYSGDLVYLRNVTYNTWKSLKAADPAAVWLMQGWLFFSNSHFWTNDRVEAYLSGVENDSDMLILDLFSEAQPQWQRTNSYYGKPWIWCQLHDYGANMGLYGQVENVTINPIEALANSSSLVGFGLTMEGQEGNEIMYDLLLDQAWSGSPIDTEVYFHDWVTNRYAGAKSVPVGLYSAWDLMRSTVYNNTNLTSNAVPKSIFELSPNTTGLLNRTGHHPTTLGYSPSVVAQAWNLMYDASLGEPSLMDNPAFQYDMIDVTRQVMSNAFTPLYTDFVTRYMASNATDSSLSALSAAGQKLLTLLVDLDAVLSTNTHFALSTWLASARAWANTNTTANSTDQARTADLYEYSARNQITLWGPTGQINDYASKAWGGLIASYYVPRWTLFVDHLTATRPSSYNATALAAQLRSFEQAWQTQTWGERPTEKYATTGELASVLARVRGKWPSVFGI